MFLCCLYNEIFDFFFITNHLISKNQSSFKPGDFCINQLLSFTNGIYASFDEGYEGVIIDVSKVFDEVWCKRLIFKLKAKWNIWQFFTCHKRLPK